jgi:hypothetical protein
MKRLSAQAIDNQLVAVLGLDAVGDSAATNYLRQRHFPSILRENPDEQLYGIYWDFPNEFRISTFLSFIAGVSD